MACRLEDFLEGNACAGPEGPGRLPASRGNRGIFGAA